jgi:hypothetical protein
MDASVVALAQTCSEAMVKRPAKAHLFFLNMGCPSIEIERDHLAIQWWISLTAPPLVAPKFKTVS